ncbi:MAG: DNA primase [uncultured bacterium (gcode 4)]|uniref:DNA primase n=1 Tax=uncultured bacterium (gcode 4) TaxID=1234023 RepID=K2F9W7_9BACT|nr:MAG: DNA primase [uncultured bacterium (gcode 4)]
MSYITAKHDLRIILAGYGKICDQVESADKSNDESCVGESAPRKVKRLADFCSGLPTVPGVSVIQDSSPFTLVLFLNMNIWSRERDFYSRRPIPASSVIDELHFKELELRMLREKMPIVNLVKKYVHIYKPNKNWIHYIGLCPFHVEKTPSFWVSPQKWIFHCWWCWAWWDVFTFIQKIEWVNFAWAIKIAKKMLWMQEGRRFAKIYKKNYFSIESRFNESWERIEEMIFLEDEISQRVRDVIYAEKEDKYSLLHWKTLDEVLTLNRITEKLPKNKKAA